MTTATRAPAPGAQVDAPLLEIRDLHVTYAHRRGRGCPPCAVST